MLLCREDNPLKFVTTNTKYTINLPFFSSSFTVLQSYNLTILSFIILFQKATEKHYNQFLLIQNSTKMNIKFLIILLFSCFTFSTFAQRMVNRKPVRPTVKVQRLSNNINTNVSDFAPTRYGDRIYYTSMYKKLNDGSMITRIYSFMEDGDRRLEEELNMKRKAAHIAHMAFMPDASRMYFTICKDEDQEKCQIWYRDRAFEGDWGTAQRLPEVINQRGSTSTQPTIGWDEEQKKFALFFVSDRKGGRGGKDIWVSHITFDGKFLTPYALPINTAGDEVTPYFDRNSQVLYFSSNGRKGNGGFDIFESEKRGDLWNRPRNMGRPYNSGYDDLYYMTHEVSGTAYFTSDRPGSICKTGDVSGWNCYDIYQVQDISYDEPMLSGKNKHDGNMVMHYIEN